MLKLDWLKLCLTRDLLYFVMPHGLFHSCSEICIKLLNHEFQSDAIVICFLHVWIVKVCEMLFWPDSEMLLFYYFLLLTTEGAQCRQFPFKSVDLQFGKMCAP